MPRADLPNGDAMIGIPSTRPNTLLALTESLRAEETAIQQGGGEAGVTRQRKLGRMTARERIARLIDRNSQFRELNLWAAYGMYERWGNIAAAGVVTGIGRIHHRPCMIVANDATVKAGAFFPQTAKKVLRAQRIAYRCNLPLVYLVDSAGVFLPMQDEIFPDEDDFGRIFRNNAVLSAAGVPQFAAIMGNCVAGGAYLPVLCDTVLMTEGSTLHLAGPSLVKAAIGQDVDEEELGGAKMHAAVSGTVDFFEPDDAACLERLRSLIKMLPEERFKSPDRQGYYTERDADALYELVSPDGRVAYDVRDLLECVVDAGTINEYKAEYGKSLVTAFASIDGHDVAIVANQRTVTRSERDGMQMGGVIYADSADKAARFVMDANQKSLPLVFFQDVQGFMVGRDAEQSGIIRSGAKLVSAVSNSTVPKITMVVGGSFGAGNYALCGKAFDPHFIFAWPSAKYAVMGAQQAAGTLLSLEERQSARKGQPLSEDERQQLSDEIQRRYEHQTDIRYGAARGWVDAIIAPHETRSALSFALDCATRTPPESQFHTGVLQV
ncbi:MAG: acyl-CoA carboxylase subunit beta [Pirellulales bacterium]|nr:acyl-CoA carboxylase subunit beta [Pirellulales bacterium]